MPDYCKALMVCSTLLVTPVMAEETVSLSCIWTVYDHNFETFFIDLSSKKVLWVEEETEHEISEFSRGFIKFNAPYHLVTLMLQWESSCFQLSRKGFPCGDVYGR